MTAATSNFFVSTNRDRLDMVAITDWIQSSYWGDWQAPAQIRTALENSLVFGGYEHGIAFGPGMAPWCMRGFVRVVTDKATFSAITDVFVSAPYRGRGLGHMLMEAVLAHESVSKTICILATRPENIGFYQLFGFRWLGGQVMQRSPGL